MYKCKSANLLNEVALTSPCLSPKHIVYGLINHYLEIEQYFILGCYKSAIAIAKLSASRIIF